MDEIHEFDHDIHELPSHGSATTTYIHTLQRLTREALPHINLYRDVRSIHMESRPTLDELHHETTEIKVRAHFYWIPTKKKIALSLSLFYLAATYI